MNETEAYETWLAERIALDAADLEHKHHEMRADRFRFLRGTYYLWLVRVAELAPDALGTARVPLVGDLHVENFGTWTDEAGVRRWGVNDLDELARGPWLLDLLRLAVSAVVAPHVGLEEKEICALLLQTYAAADPALALEVADSRLEKLLPKPHDADDYYAELTVAEVRSDVPAEVAAAARATAPPGWAPTWHHRVAGTGSLGHRRRAGVGAVDGATCAREVKELGPPTAAWAADRDPRLPTPEDGLYEQVLGAIHGPAQAARAAGWQIRALAPDVVRIELGALKPGATRRVLRAMARSAAGVHGADRSAAEVARREAGAVRTKDFRRLVRTVADAVRADHEAFAGSSLPSVGGGR